MTRGCSQVLKELRKIANSSDLCITEGYDDDSFHVTLPDDSKKSYCYKKWNREITAIIHQLEADGYLTQIDPYNFYLTLKGLHPYRFAWDSMREFLLKSVVVPIGISIVTSLITLWLKGLL